MRGNAGRLLFAVYFALWYNTPVEVSTVFLIRRHIYKIAPFLVWHETVQASTPTEIGAVAIYITS